MVQSPNVRPFPPLHYGTPQQVHGICQLLCAVPQNQRWNTIWPCARVGIELNQELFAVFLRRKIQRFLSQPFSVAEVFSGREGKQVSVADTVRCFKEILEGKHDEVAEANFYMKGTIDEVTGAQLGSSK